MKVKIFFTLDGVEDYFILEGVNIEQIQDLVVKECTKRNLHTERNNMYSIDMTDES